MALCGRYLDAGERAALCALSHGQVKLDGRTLGMEDRHLSDEALRGGVLCIGKRCRRVLGGALAQRALGGNEPGTYRHFEAGPADQGRSLRLQSEAEQLALLP